MTSAAAAPHADEPVWLSVDNVALAGSARRTAVALATEAGISARTIGNLAIVATELATNLGQHADDGVILLRVRRASDQVGVEIIAIDRGPGMPDVEDSARDGVSTAGTLGIGLGAIGRMADELDVYSLPGTGTVLSATLWDGPAPGLAWVSGLTRPITGEQVCGDAYAARVVQDRRQVLLCDALGHGPVAAVASQAVIAEFSGAPPLGPKAVLEYLHDRTRHTRGSVAAIAEWDAENQIVRYAGIGNVVGAVVGESERRAMVSLPGILGHQRREIREFTYPLAAGALVILHSDGLTDRWNLANYPGLVTRSPVVVAATLMRDAGKRRDDACVLVARA